MPRRRNRPKLAPDALAPDPTRQSDAFAEDRQIRSYRLWVLGYTYREIADKVGYGSHSTAMDAVKRERGKVRFNDNKALVAQQAERLEYALHVVLDVIEAGEPKERLWAIDRLTPLMKRQAELLGLDASKEAIEAAKTVIREVPLKLLPRPVERVVVDAEQAS